jgi:hypothetical protein
VAGIARGGKGPGQHIAVRFFLDKPCFENRLHQLFHKQRNAVGLGDNLLHHLGGERLAACHPPDHLLDLLACEAREGEWRDVGPGGPGRAKLRPTGQDQEQARGGDLVQEQPE